MKILRNSFCRAQQTTGGYGVYHYYMHQHNYYDCYYFFRYTHYFVFLLPFQMMGKDEEITYPWITIRICSRFIMKKMSMIWTEKLSFEFSLPSPIERNWCPFRSLWFPILTPSHTEHSDSASHLCVGDFLPFNTDRNVFLSDKPMCLVSIA